ncbi:hypothetical protein JZ751_006197 [Albula glossodonta]|uniref:Uncharacterized protein n=1 Tax=Albula glossodonta TaxID=121402 RepID=A0A8T2N4M5_9TELE|nr:hypothetical protein JZ751_006197 [Albula glossodonta]
MRFWLETPEINHVGGTTNPRPASRIPSRGSPALYANIVLTDRTDSSSAPSVQRTGLGCTVRMLSVSFIASHVRSVSVCSSPSLSRKMLRALGRWNLRTGRK